MAQRILAVDDEPDLLELLRLDLTRDGFEVETAETGQQALESARRSAPDLLILDLMLPDLPGTEVCRLLRADPDLGAIPIIMLTARAGELDRVAGLEIGADDYVTKPFSLRELRLRVRAVLRRRQSDGSGNAQVIERAPLRLDLERHRCFVEQSEIELTVKEFALLRGLMRKPGYIMTREQLLGDAWGSEIKVHPRSVDAHMKRLREKLGNAKHLIETVRGLGYRFAD